MTFQLKATVLSPAGKRVTYGTGKGAATEAEAIAELTQLLLLISGTTLSVSETISLDSTAYPTGGTGAFEDGNISMRKLVGGEYRVKNRPVQNLLLSLRAAAGSPILDDTLLANFITAWRDGAGASGYSANPGQSQFTK